MLWAVRAVPVLVIFGTLDLVQKDPPTSFLVLTLVQLALGVLTLAAIHKQRRDRLALAYVVVVFVTSLVHPVRGGQLLFLSALALVVIAGDQVWRRTRRSPSDETDRQELDEARPE
jgi:hypothetical protein